MQYLHFTSTTKTTTLSKFHIFLYCPLCLQLETTKHTIRSYEQRTTMKGLTKPQ